MNKKLTQALHSTTTSTSSGLSSLGTPISETSKSSSEPAYPSTGTNSLEDPGTISTVQTSLAAGSS